VPATLTLTGLDAYNGKYIYASTPKEIYAVADLHDEYHPGGSFYKAGVIENGSVTLLVWKITLVENEDEGFFNVVKEPYTRGGAMNFSVLIWGGQEVFHHHYGVGGGKVSVKFNNGKAEGVFVLGEGWE
jgi:hypothetical protein